MRIGIYAFGTRGDVQPAIALGKGLISAGYEVSIIAGSNSEAFIKQHGIDYLPLSVDIQDVMQSEQGKEWVDASDQPMKQLGIMKQLAKDFGATITQEMWQAYQQVDAVICNFTSVIFVLSYAEHSPKPVINAPYQPMHATRAGWANYVAFRPNYSVLNLISSAIGNYAGWGIYGEVVNQQRTQILNLPPYSLRTYLQARAKLPTIYGFSEHIIPKPRDWSENRHIAGYWFLDDMGDWQVSPALQEFLEAGSAPIYMGFGSMGSSSPEKAAKLMIDALTKTGHRGIISSGWAGLESKDLPETIFQLDFAPHQWLFPHMAGVIHHGGAGTTAAAIRAGVPQTIIPHMSDQPLWGRRIHELGIGTKAIDRHKLTSDNLAEAIEQLVENTSLRKNTEQMGKLISAEDGVTRAIELMQPYFN